MDLLHANGSGIISTRNVTTSSTRRPKTTAEKKRREMGGDRDDISELDFHEASSSV
jgi:hypothetical protein